ncbi:MAG: two-component system, OmpR family, sensor kinase [Solirubrobacteraceae bacterium]|jgi:signal transduction histidine kinase|nr:two-component system, OmpR family, sensor kinase [Solirubrobacteraceae bacterium]
MSRASSIRSAAQATFSAHRQLPIRWRLAGGSALLTLIILCGFAGAVGALTTARIHEDFRAQVTRAADKLKNQVQWSSVGLNPDTGERELDGFSPGLDSFAESNGAVIRIVTTDGRAWRTTHRDANLGAPVPGARDYNGYRIETRLLPYGVDPGQYPYLDQSQHFFIQYARPLSEVNKTIGVLRLFLLGGVLGGAGLALLAGLMLARRAMAPISSLIETARKIERTRDPALAIPQPEADDEVAELARTLEDMLHALDRSRSETEAALAQQRDFVADASHELRTPLTSVLANLELLADGLDGDQHDAASSALRSSQRMRRLVADLLLLARADAKRKVPHAPVDLGKVLIEAAGELSPIAHGHELSIDASRGIVDGARDELHQLVVNLMENAIRHTPDGTHIRAAVDCVEGVVRLNVEDDGPGIPAAMRERIFERFFRGAGDRGGSSGLGLAIVQSVTESHGGAVTLHSPTKNGKSRPRGTRFEVTFPASTAQSKPREKTGARYARSAS